MVVLCRGLKCLGEWGSDKGLCPYTLGWGSFGLLKMDCVRVAWGGSLSTLHWHDNLLFNIRMLLHKLGVVSFSQWLCGITGMAEQLLDGFTIQTLLHPIETVGHSVVRPLQVLNGEVVPHQCCHPPVSYSIQVGC